MVTLKASEALPGMFIYCAPKRYQPLKESQYMLRKYVEGAESAEVIPNFMCGESWAYIIKDGFVVGEIYFET